MSAQTPKKRSAARKKPKRDTTPGLPKQPKQDPTPGPPKQPKHDPTSGLLKDVLETFSPPVLEGSERYVVPEDLVYIGSYNWVETPNPTIIVPGSPRIWADRELPMTVPLDSGEDFIDQNGHRMEDYTLLPLIKAVQDLTDQGVTQKFDWPSVDIVTDRGRLRKLLWWATGRSGQWRVDTQLAGTNTVLLTGRPQVTRGPRFQGASYGFSFKEASTYSAPGLGNEPGHHRIVAYNFDGLRMVVRFEVDACLPYDAASSVPPSNNPVIGRRSTKGNPFSGSDLDPPVVKIIRGGSSQVPQTNLVEIHDHNNRDLRWPDAYPQLYLTKTPHMYHAFHKNGVFTSVKKFTLGQSELADVDKSEQVGFKKLRKLLGDIRTLVLKHGPMRISLVCVGKKLSAYQIPEGEDCLPKDALDLFEVL